FNCPEFAAGDYYSRPVANAPVDPNSDRYIQAAIAAGNTSEFWIAAKPAHYINVAQSSTRMYRVRPKVAYHSFDVPYPWSPDFKIEPLSDAHAIVVQDGTCDLYETYNTTFAAGVLSAYSGAHWNLYRAFAPLPPGNPSAMASGLSLYAGMIRWEEVASGAIDHALNWAAPAGTVSQWSFVRPASDAEGIPFKGSSPYRLPYGAHLRLKASFDISRFGPQSRAIARAMKTYGIFLADTAKQNSLYNAMPLTGSNAWKSSDLAALGSIHISDFEVLSLGKTQQVPGH
ncbi:MAG: hypothetical protein WA814_10590, partial [Candidatus Baltobacteraceae bacterium]